MRILAVLLLAALGACALDKPPAREDSFKQSSPNLKAPEGWVEKGGMDGPVGNDWLAAFNDPRLDALVREALAYNVDLQSAAARVESAAASVKAAGATLYPQVHLLARGGGAMSGDSSGLEGVGIFANWELDVWGRVRAGRALTQEQYGASELDRLYARQSLAALVAKSWFLATEARLQKAVADEMSAAAARSVALALHRQRIGVGDEYDVTLARASLATYRDAARNLEQAYRQSLRALEALAGRYPAAALEVPPELAALPGPVPVGMPSQLLERRPDVLAAERRLASAFYGTEQAKAARWPTISLTASVSTVSSELFVLKNRDNPVWSAGASIMAPIFQGGQLQAQVEARTAEQKVALAEYGRVGSGDLRAVQQQALALSAARAALLRVQAERLVQRVNLHLALGGSFDTKQ